MAGKLETIGGVLAALDSATPRERPALLDECGGAMLRLSRVEANGMEKHLSVQFATPVLDTVPSDQRESIRVACSGREVMTVVRTMPVPHDAPKDHEPVRYPVRMALCPRCSGFEIANRTNLAREKAARGEGSR